MKSIIAGFPDILNCNLLIACTLISGCPIMVEKNIDKQRGMGCGTEPTQGVGGGMWDGTFSRG